MSDLIIGLPPFDSPPPDYGKREPRPVTLQYRPVEIEPSRASKVLWWLLRWTLLAGFAVGLGLLMEWMT